MDKFYKLKGIPVEIICRWGRGGGPRNVLIQFPDGRREIRPFRGLRKIRSTEEYNRLMFEHFGECPGHTTTVQEGDNLIYSFSILVMPGIGQVCKDNAADSPHPAASNLTEVHHVISWWLEFSA